MLICTLVVCIWHKTYFRMTWPKYCCSYAHTFAGFLGQSGNPSTSPFRLGFSTPPSGPSKCLLMHLKKSSLIPIFMTKYLCTQLFDGIIKSTKTVFKQFKPCSNHGILVLFEHAFYLQIPKTGRRLFT